MPFRKHSRAASVRQARLAALLVFVTRLKKRHTVSLFLRSPTPSAAVRRLPEVAVKNPVSVIGKRKDHPCGWSFLLLVAGVGFEPHDLRVMSPTSYQAALPRDINWYLKKWCRKPGSNRYEIKSHGILSPGRLPVPPFRQTFREGRPFKCPIIIAQNLTVVNPFYKSC